jgi:hypothetical protein
MMRSIGFLLAFFALFALGVQGSSARGAAQTPPSGRSRTVTIDATQYLWELVSNVDGRVICQVATESPNPPNNDEAIQLCGNEIFPIEPTPTPISSSVVVTPAPSEPFDLAEFFGSVSWRLITSQRIQRTVSVPLPELITNLAIPAGQSSPPFFVTLTAYEPVHGERITQINGLLGSFEFTCAGNRCDVPITTDSVIEFWAVSSLGDESHHTQATLRLVRLNGGSRLQVESIQPITVFQDSCSAIWRNPQGVRPFWASLPASPGDMATNKPYQFLAGRLIAAGFVNASDCPGGGLFTSGAPNACGLERAAAAVIEWQNQYDVNIWEAGREYGIPPLLVKTLIEQESQFWPGNSIRALYEFGLGQLSPTGLDVAMRWDNELFARACEGLFLDCSRVYGRMPASMQASVRGSLMRSMDALCPTCPNGIEMAVAYDSIPIITRTLRANCRQVQFVMDTKRLVAEYEDLWKFTFLSYHSGYQCFADALDYAIFNRVPVNWANLAGFLTCAGAQTYVDNAWKSLAEFETFRLQEPVSAQPTVVPTFQATPVPTRTPTPVLAMGHLRVLVYVDENNNNIAEANERAEDVRVIVTFDDGTVVEMETVNGEVIVDLSGRPVGGEVIVALPELFRSALVRISRDGEIPVIFRLEEPVVPPALP